MRYLMTHSLLSSWLYAISENPYEDATTEKNPMDEFMRVLRREPTPTTVAMQNGIDFENLVTSIVNGSYKPIVTFSTGTNPNTGEHYEQKQYHRWYDAAKDIADIIRGGVLQYATKREIVTEKRNVLLYGRLDALKAGTVYDIKFSGNYEIGKFRESTQHPMYLSLIPEAEQFVYLVSNGSLVWTESYRRDETGDIAPIVDMFFRWLEGQGLENLYCSKWQAL